MKVQKTIWYIFLLLFCGIAYFLYVMHQNNKRTHSTFVWVNHTHQVIEEINYLNAAVLDFESQVRGYVITGNPEFLKEYNKADDKIMSYVNHLEVLISDNPVQRKNVAVAKNITKAKIQFQANVVDLYRSSPQQALQLIAGLKGKKLTDRLKAVLTTMQNHEQQLLTIRVERNKAISESKYITSTWSLIFFFLLISFALFHINKENKLRKRAEQSSRENALKYSDLIENLSVVTYTVDLEGVFQYVSSKCKELTGYLPEAIIGNKIHFLIHPDWQEQVEAFYQDQLMNDIYETVLAFPIITKDGTHKWIEQSVVLLKTDGVPSGFQSITKDVTERKETEEKLQKAENKIKAEKEEYQFRLQAILDNTPMAMYIKDLEGKFLMVNKGFKKTFKVSDEQIIGKYSHDIDKLSSMAEKFKNSDNKVIQSLQPFEEENYILTSEGEKHMLVTKFPLLDKNNQLFAICGVDKDITDIVRNRQQLINARFRAERAEKLQEEFLANMSHEIRTPMNGIIGMANLLKESELNNDQEEFVQLIIQSSDTLLVLINDILDLSKIKAGRMSIEQIDFSLHDLMNTVIAPMQIKAASKSIQIKTKIDGQIPSFIKGDQHKLAQILNNLVSNAIKFTQKGEILIEVSLKEQNNDTASLHFMVKDTGIGIAAEHIDYIFESFVQAGNDMIRRFGGTGLGLAITKRMIEIQGGNIEVQSEVGVGTQFDFSLTFLHTQEKINLQKKESYKFGNNHSLIGKKILVVEDNVINQKVISLLLEKIGIEVVIANNGKEAVDLLEHGQQYHLIIMDLQMPVMNGFQATTYIRKKLNLNIPIIAMTASALRNEKLKCFELGMNEYITKPFVPAELFKQLHRFLDENEVTEEPSKVSGINKCRDLYNLSYLEEMEDHDYTIEVINLFLSNTPALLAELKDSVLNEKWEEVYRNAHKLKSSFGFLQMNKMLQKVNEIEFAAKNHDNLEKIPHLVKGILQQFDLIKPMLEADIEKTMLINN